MMDECTCGKIPYQWARLVDPECKAIHHDETHGYHTADGEPVGYEKLLRMWSDERTENTRLREFFEAMAKDVWDLHTIDGGNFQDAAEKLGLIVRVPADEQFKAEWDADEMFVWSWHPLATEALESK